MMFCSDEGLIDMEAKSFEYLLLNIWRLWDNSFVDDISFTVDEYEDSSWWKLIWKYHWQDAETLLFEMVGVNEPIRALMEMEKSMFKEENTNAEVQCLMNALKQ